MGFGLVSVNCILKRTYSLGVRVCRHRRSRPAPPPLDGPHQICRTPAEESVKTEYNVTTLYALHIWNMMSWSTMSWHYAKHNWNIMSWNTMSWHSMLCTTGWATHAFTCEVISRKCTENSQWPGAILNRCTYVLCTIPTLKQAHFSSNQNTLHYRVTGLLKGVHCTNQDILFLASQQEVVKRHDVIVHHVSTS